MSWQAYVDSNLVGTGHVSKAAIHGIDGSVWATSAGLSISAKEATALVTGINDPTPFQTGGIMLQGKKYQFLRNEKGRSVYGKLGADDGCVIVKTAKAVLVALYTKGTTAGNCTLVVEKLADYLMDNGY